MNTFILIVGLILLVVAVTILVQALATPRGGAPGGRRADRRVRLPRLRLAADDGDSGARTSR